MSTSRPTRTRAKTVQPPPTAASSDEALSDVENTPRPFTKQNYPSPTASRRKHRGDAATPLKDISSSAINNTTTSTPINDSRMLLRTVSLNDVNDDLAERRRRRKSNKILAQPSMEEVDSVMHQAHEDALTIPLSSQPSQSGPNAPQPRPSIIPLIAVEEAPLIRVPLDVMSSNFEEWMKLATDNKINAANSWNFALIDYFHDMSLLRNVTDNSINFQKASCTLDGCVKIWTSRVDSVGTETFKLVSNLASEGNTENLEDPSEQTQDPQKKRTNAGKHRTESTLAKSAAQLRTKKLELEFMVDPLFKKTCADFDESGAQGLLMNHLNLGLGAGCLRVVFDAGDCVAASGENVEDDADAETEEPEDLIDLGHLRKEFFPSIEVLETKAISHSLEGFSFERGAFDFTDITVLDTTNLAADSDGDDNEVGVAMDEQVRDDDENMIQPDGGIESTSHDSPHVEDFFVGDQAIEDDYGADNYGDPDAPAPAYPNPTGNAGVSTYEPFDPRRAPNERDLVMAMTVGETEGDESGGMMDYFDQNFLKNWAGPEHWKVKRTVRRPLDAANSPNAGENAGQKTRREKKDKDVNKFDFSKPLEISVKELFTPLSTKSGGGKKAKEKEKRSDQTLPDDMHFSSKQLVTLFLKPRFSLKMRGHRARINDGDGEVDERFWAQAAADQAQAQLNAQDETVDGGAIPFNTQFFHDDYEDGGGFEDVFEGEGRSGADASVDPEEQNLLAATEGQSRRIRPEFVNYAKRAKRVDVRKLKENIWKGLNDVIEALSEDSEISSAQQDENEEEDVEMEITGNDTRRLSRAAISQSDGRVFETVISRLKENYPPDKMSEISTSFCFICLLHLANEEGLRVRVGDNSCDKSEDLLGSDFVNEEKGVGNLWNLQIFKDPSAVLAA